LKRRLEEVLESGQFVLGPNVAAFEEEAAAYLGVPAAVGVGNGTDALVLVFNALELGRDDEVICPAFTFFATAEAIARAGATPVFADIDPATFNLDAADVAERITPRTKAIVPVHLFGRPAPLGRLAQFGLPLVEDAAQAFGAAGVATTGVASTFSFYPSKNLFGIGDGGLVAVTDQELGERIRMLRFHGSKAKKIFEFVGTNSRLDEIQAAALRLFLEQLDSWNADRREAAARYRGLGIGDLCEAPDDDPAHVYHLFVCRSAERDRIQGALTEAGIGNAHYYLPPLHLQPALAYLGYREGDLPETERAARENFSIPIWPGITEEQQERVVETVKSAATVRV
jgi:dTDP-4-amino-4,6-dideoxygalactose transaminase